MQEPILVHRCGDPVASGIASGSGQRLDCLTIDMHCHAFIPEAQALLAGSVGANADAQSLQTTFGAESLAINQQQLAVIGPKLVTLEARLSDMDAMGVDIQAISVSPTQYYYSVEEEDRAAAIVDAINVSIAESCTARPDRFVGLATVSLQHPGLAARQLHRAVGELGLRGVEISTHVNGVNISDRRFDPFWSAADELGLVVFLHPWGTTVGTRLERHYLGNTVGQPMETAIALSNLIFDGTLDRHKSMKIVAAHGGGYLPLYISRSDHAYNVRPEACGCVLPPSAYLRRIWFDTLIYEPAHLNRLIELVGASQMVLGTDYPFDMGHYDPAGLLGKLPQEALEAIAGGNAASLLGLNDLMKKGMA